MVEYWIIYGVMVSVINPSVVDRGFERRPGQNKDNKIGICCVAVEHAALRSKTACLRIRIICLSGRKAYVVSVR